MAELTYGVDPRLYANPDLQGHNAPVHEEIDVDKLTMGAWCRYLYRNQRETLPRWSEFQRKLWHGGHCSGQRAVMRR